MNSVSFVNVGKKFNQNIIFKDLNYTFYSGKCYVVQGESGIGKTTLLNMISGYIKPDYGQIVMNDCLKIDYMFQEELFFSNLTVIENMALKYYANSNEDYWDTDDIKKKFNNVLKQFHIENLVDRKISNLSGGEKQRVQLAGMIISDAQVLLLDEPVTKLDYENRELILHMIETCVPGRIVIIVSHIDLDFQGEVTFLKLENGVLNEKKKTYK